jgi:2-methylcitrate dehydratase PrpD
VRDTVRLHLADTVGAWLAGAGTPEGRALSGLTQWMREHPGLGNFGESLPDQIMARCATTRLSELDDIHLGSCTTQSAVIIPAALTMARFTGKPDPARTLEAITLGYEAMTRLGTALDGARILYRGIWTTYFIAPFGVAVVAARLYGLSDRQAAHAMALALTMAPPSVGRHGGAMTSRWVSFGRTAANGAVAALAAQAGFTADLNLFEGDFFPSVYNLTPDLAALRDGFGDGSAITGVSIKPWSGARQTMAAVQAFKEIIESGVDPKAVTAVKVFVPGVFMKMIDHGILPGGDRMSRITSVQYQMAMAALTPNSMCDVNQGPKEPSPEITAFMGKIKVESDDALLPYFPKEWRARVVVTTGSGRHERLVTQIPGDPGRPFDEKQVAAKFRRALSQTVDTHAIDELLGLALAALEEDQGVPSLLNAIERFTAGTSGLLKNKVSTG